MLRLRPCLQERSYEKVEGLRVSLDDSDVGTNRKATIFTQFSDATIEDQMCVVAADANSSKCCIQVVRSCTAARAP